LDWLALQWIKICLALIETLIHNDQLSVLTVDDTPYTCGYHQVSDEGNYYRFISLI